MHRYVGVLHNIEVEQNKQTRLNTLMHYLMMQCRQFLYLSYSAMMKSSNKMEFREVEVTVILNSHCRFTLYNSILIVIKTWILIGPKRSCGVQVIR